MTRSFPRVTVSVLAGQLDAVLPEDNAWVSDTVGKGQRVGVGHGRQRSPGEARTVPKVQATLSNCLRTEAGVDTAKCPGSLDEPRTVC